MPTKESGSLSDHFYTAKEAARYIGVSYRTFHRYLKKPVNKGGPPRRKFGNCVRIPIEQFIEWANPKAGA